MEDLRAAQLPEAAGAPYFAVSLLKLSVMSICTAGLYELYWFYKNWDLIRYRERSDIMPVARGIFAFFFCYQCFSRIRATATTHDLPTFPAGPLAAGWIVTTLLYKLPDPYWFVCYLAFLFILPVQATANRINLIEEPGHDQNSHFSQWNVAAIIIGGILLVLAIIGTLLPGE